MVKGESSGESPEVGRLYWMLLLLMMMVIVMMMFLIFVLFVLMMFEFPKRGAQEFHAMHAQTVANQATRFELVR